MGSSSAVGVALVKLGGTADVRGGPLLVSSMHGPLEDREIKLVARMDDKFPEIDFADRPNRVQVRCEALAGES